MITPMDRRRFFKLLAAVSGTAILAACAPQPTPVPAAPKTEPTKAPTAAQPPKAEAPKPAPSEAIELRLHVRTGTEQDALEDLIPPFEQEQKVKVKIESFPGGEYYQKLQILLAGGTAGDVWWNVVLSGQGYSHAASGLLLFLDDLIKAENFDLSQYYPVAIKGCQYEGKMLGLPFKLHPGVVGLYYNAKIMSEAGVPDPKPQTYPELVEIAKKATKTEGGKISQYGILMPLATSPHFFICLTRAWGSDIISTDGKKALMNTEKSMDAMKFVYDMIFKDKVAVPGTEMSQGENLFIAGTVGMYQSGSWTKSIPTRIKENFQVKNVLMPKGPSGKIGRWMVTDTICVSAKTKYPKQSWELTKLLCGKEAGIRLGEGKGGASGTSGGRKDVFESERLKANILHPIWIEAVSVEEEGSGMIVPANFRGDETWTTLKQKMDPLWLGDAKPEKAFFDDVNAAMQAVLDKPRP